MVAHARGDLETGVDRGREPGARARDRVVLFGGLAVVGRLGRRGVGAAGHEAGLQVPELGDVGGRALEILGVQGPAQAVDRFRAADRRGDVRERRVHAGLGHVQLAHFTAHPLRQGGRGRDAGGQGLGVGL
jgi:hypothetical protein